MPAHTSLAALVFDRAEVLLDCLWLTAGIVKNVNGGGNTPHVRKLWLNEAAKPLHFAVTSFDQPGGRFQPPCLFQQVAQHLKAHF